MITFHFQNKGNGLKMGREEDKAKVREISLAGQFAESAYFVTRPIK
jgi:hypothetical protein